MRTIVTVALAALALAGCQGDTGETGAEGEEIRIVGSSTVYPFTTAVAEQFQRNNSGLSAIVESTGTGAGLNLFCAGVGEEHPDMVNASRRIKPSELEQCQKNGVQQVIEVPIGIDGLVMIESKSAAHDFALTPADIYMALAANPYGKPNTAKTWRDVNPALPALPIQVFGPPPTSGTRDSFAELILEKGCDANPEMKALKAKDADQHKSVCTKVREDGAFIEAGENDNLLVQRVAQNPGAVGILGFSFFEENADKLRGIPLGGIAPTSGTIAGLTYPGARQLYVYVKGEHVNVVPGMKEFLAEYARGWTADGYLVRRGLIPSPPQVQQAAQASVTSLKPLAPADLGS